MLKYDLTPQIIRRLQQQFDELDNLGSGHIDKADFYAALGIKPNFFADKVFSLVDLNKNDDISFYEFVCCTCSYCSYTHGEVLRFCFDVFDGDKSGYLDDAELKHLVHVLHTMDLDRKKPGTNVNIVSGGGGGGDDGGGADSCVCRPQPSGFAELVAHVCSTAVSSR